MSDYAGLLADYERVYRQGRRPGCVYDTAQLVSLCERLQVLAPDAYRRATWERRAWLHQHGRHGEVFDGTDALRWKQAHQHGRSPEQLAAMRRRGFSKRSTGATGANALAG